MLVKILVEWHYDRLLDFDVLRFQVLHLLLLLLTKYFWPIRLLILIFLNLFHFYCTIRIPVEGKSVDLVRLLLLDLE
jgi:hypothetical protein